ncbi:hypothetical protein EV174_006754, partial [Coemansia sp. RSA 2320]
MDINDIFKESVTNTALMPSRSKRKLGATPGLRALKEGGYGIADADSLKEMEGENDKRAKRGGAGELTSDGEQGASDDGEGGRFFSDGLTSGEKDVLA